MNIAICGATGCVGSHLSSYLFSVGHKVTAINRKHLTVSNIGLLQEIVDSSDVVINLAGSPITQPWSKENLRKIVESRTKVTKRLVDIINRSARPQLFICASAAGYHTCEETLSPNREQGQPLTQLVDSWEREARRLNSKTRLVIARLSVVFTPRKGALPKMLESSKWGFLAKIGSHKRVISWIAIEDVARAIEHVIEHKEMDGAVNISNPHPTTQSQFLECAKRRLGAKIVITIPPFILRIIYGQAAQLILQNNHSHPQRLQQSGYEYLHPTIESYFIGVDL